MNKCLRVNSSIRQTFSLYKHGPFEEVKTEIMLLRLGPCDHAFEHDDHAFEHDDHAFVRIAVVSV